jgi:hypothetical protein
MAAIPKDRYVKAGDPLARAVETVQRRLHEGLKKYRNACDLKSLRANDYWKRKREAL